MMMAHKWLDAVSRTSKLPRAFLDDLLSAVQFDCSNVESILSDAINSEDMPASFNPPYRKLLIQCRDLVSNTGVMKPMFVYWEEVGRWKSLVRGEEVVSICSKMGIGAPINKEEYGTTVLDVVFGVPGQESVDFVEGQIKDAALILGYNKEAHGDLAMQEEGLKVYPAAIAVALGLFTVLGFSGVTVTDVEAPVKLNKKRIKIGKLPIHSHKTLSLCLGEKTVSLHGGGGTHASPRIHLRRGHKRSLGDGKFTWVRSCVVGSASRGIVSKDYRLEA